MTAFPGYAFDVTLGIGDSATVRFSRLRADEVPWLSSDLEGFKHEAILVLTVDEV